MAAVWRLFMTRLLTPRWLGATAAALAFFALCLFLGDWQYGRHEARAANADRVEQHYSAAPVPVDTVSPAGATGLAEAEEWTRVTATGTYDRAGQLMVRNRPQNIVYGYEVLVPLVLDDGTALVVDRGWVKNAERADVLPDVPAAPAGRVTVTGWLRPGEPTVGEGLPPGQIASIDLGRAQAATGHDLRSAYLVLESENDGSGTEPARPAPLLPPDTGLGVHFAYALQWWGASIVGFVIVFVYLRREVRDELQADLASGTDQAVPSGAAGRPRAPKPKKVRIWDEEDA
ncbi:MAG: SURF1 family protein [Dermatophilus congolensis]|nr:SURF1 family protein [Dermatophilus congolensis]